MNGGRGHLLVFRDAAPPRPRRMDSPELADLLCKWLKWHDSLRDRGVLRCCRAIDLPGSDRIVGYLVVEAGDLSEATSIAQTCPGLQYGFAVDIFPCRESRTPPL